MTSSGNALDTALQDALRGALAEVQDDALPETEPEKAQAKTAAPEKEIAPEPDEPTEAADAAPEADEAETAEAAAPEESDEPAETEDIPVPYGWKAEEKEFFKALPREARDIILRREKERDDFLTKRSKEIKAHEKFIEQVNAVLEPHRQTWRLNGFEDAQAISHAIEVARFVNQQPQQALEWLSQRLGYQPQHQGDESDGADLTDPALKGLAQDVQGLKAGLSGFIQQQTQQTVQQKIDAFRDATTADGQPAHPHFGAVEGFMAELIQKGVAADLPSAYEMATKIKGLNGAPTPTAAATQKLREQQEAAERARKAKRVARASGAKSGGGTTGRTIKSLDDALNLTRQSLGGT